eukprot:721576-Rhodomonas_salina.2
MSSQNRSSGAEWRDRVLASLGGVDSDGAVVANLKLEYRGRGVRLSTNLSRHTSAWIGEAQARFKSQVLEHWSAMRSGEAATLPMMLPRALVPGMPITDSLHSTHLPSESWNLLLNRSRGHAPRYGTHDTAIGTDLIRGTDHRITMSEWAYLPWNLHVMQGPSSLISPCHPTRQ